MLGTHPGLFSSLLQWHLHTAAPVRCPSQNARCSTSSLECAWSLVGCCVRPASWAALAKMQANKTESSCPCLDGDTIQRVSSLGCLLLFCLRHWTKTVSFPLWSNKNTYRVKCGRKKIAQRLGNGVFGSVSTGFLSQERCPQTLCPQFSRTLLCRTFW